jgi:dienelactone hydrolase
MTTIIGRICLLWLLLAPSLLSAQTKQFGEFVVFIHSGGGNISDRDLRDIGARLVSKGYVVRAPDDQRDEKGGPGVDYFSNLALEAAQDVADIVNARLKALQPPNADNKELKPRLQRNGNPGYLGVWLF